MRFGYAVEYDYAPPTQLHATLETKRVRRPLLRRPDQRHDGLRGGRRQGLIAGINAALVRAGPSPFVLDRSQAYIGVLIDDLVTRGSMSPTACSPAAPNTGCCSGMTTPTSGSPSWAVRGIGRRPCAGIGLKGAADGSSGCEARSTAPASRATAHQILRRPETTWDEILVPGSESDDPRRRPRRG